MVQSAGTWLLLSPDRPQVGEPADDDATPLPARVTVAGELLALLAMLTPPGTLPAAAGAKLTVRVALWPGASTCPLLMPLTLKPVPVTLIPDTVTLELPLFERVVFRLLVAPTFTFPKLKLVGLALSESVAAFTVRVAALLVALPALLETTTVNCAPLSAVVSEGVV